LTAVDRLDSHCQVVLKRLEAGKVIPFLGAGANLCDRPAHVNWLRKGLLPSGVELARYLAKSYSYPEREVRDLARVAQYVELTAGDATLFEELHAIFVGDQEPNKLHRLQAEIPALLRARGALAGQLLITTNYDDALERAFAKAGEPFDLVYYADEPDEPGRFVHVRPDGRHVEIPKHTEYRAFALEERTVILKIHGAIDRANASRDSYVITEDDYIEYLARENVAKLIPAQLMARMRTSHFLFLGYGMRDWNLRVILRYIWSEQRRRFGSWAIQRDPSEIDRRFWERHGVEIINVPLEDWVDAMHEQMK
jgi:SIR2-like domain